MLGEHIPLHYGQDARSVHVLLRIVDPDNPDRTNEVLFDNLTTPMTLLGEWEDVVIVEETIIQDPFPDHPLDADPLVDALARGWRETASGDPGETLLVICHGDPELLDVE